MDRAKEHYGFGRPYNFRVVIPLSANAVALLGTLITLALLLPTPYLTIGTERFYFVLYIVTLLTLGAALSRTTLISFALLLLAILEATLAASSVSLRPRDIFSTPSDSRFQYHPILQSVPVPNWHGTIRYDGRNRGAIAWSSAFTARFFDQDFTFRHNSLGLRGDDLTAKDRTLPMIFAYGGSTTYDYTVSQGETWVERLQANLGGDVRVINFGVPGHTTAEHVIHTAFYQTLLRNKPVCAIYYMGWNDIGGAHVDNLDPAYANYHALFLAIRKKEPWLAKFSPLLRLAVGSAQRRLDSIPNPPNYYGKPPGTGSDSRLEKFFTEHAQTIVALNNSRGIKTIFIGQILNKELLEAIPPSSPVFFPLIKYQDMWPLQERFNSILASASQSLGANYIDPDVANFRNSDFTDLGHFSSAGSMKFATLVAPEIKQLCLKAE